MQHKTGTCEICGHPQTHTWKVRQAAPQPPAAELPAAHPAAAPPQFLALHSALKKTLFFRDGSRDGFENCISAPPPPPLAPPALAPEDSPQQEIPQATITWLEGAYKTEINLRNHGRLTHFSTELPTASSLSPSVQQADGTSPAPYGLTPVVFHGVEWCRKVSQFAR